MAHVQATYTDLATKLYSSPEVKDSKRFSVPKRVPNGFTIEHYAGAVTYKTENFLDKNRDFVVGEHQALMQGSSSGFVRGLFPPDDDGASAKSTPVSVATSQATCAAPETSWLTRLNMAGRFAPQSLWAVLV